MRGLNLDHVNAFTEVVRLGSFSAAASHLNLTQPAISQQIGQLEKRLGVRLLERLGRRAMPTAAGTELLDHAARLDGAVAALLEGMARFTSGEVGSVRLGTGATAAIFRLPPMLRSLRRKLPDLEITIATGNTSDVVKARAGQRARYRPGDAAGGRPRSRGDAGARRRVRGGDGARTAWRCRSA